MAYFPVRRGARTALAAGLVAVALATLVSPQALADPTPAAPPASAPAAPPASAPAAPPASASEAQQQLTELGHQAEVLSEQLHGAQIALDQANADKATAQGQLAANQATLSGAQSQQQQYQGTVDTLAAASYQGARLNRLSALMTSRSPQDLLDQMSGLELLARDTSTQLAVYQAASATATRARAAAQRANDAAGAAADQATAAQASIQIQQAALQTQTDSVRLAYSRLSATEQAAYAGTSVPAGFTTPGPGTGSGQGYAALQAALGKMGTPYVWGASGPGSFDCSGLTAWAFAQIGVSIPRSSQAQAGAGTPVSRADLQPGDLVFFYNSVSHVGIYAGNGMVLHAPTFGQNVKVTPMEYLPYNSARRY